MAKKRKFEVQAEDGRGDIWMVATNLEESVAEIEARFKRDGLKNVKVIKN